MVNIVDIPILKKKYVVLIIGIIIGFFIFKFISSNNPSLLNCNITEKFEEISESNPFYQLSGPPPQNNSGSYPPQNNSGPPPQNNSGSYPPHPPQNKSCSCPPPQNNSGTSSNCPIGGCILDSNSNNMDPDDSSYQENFVNDSSQMFPIAYSDKDLDSYESVPLSIKHAETVIPPIIDNNSNQPNMNIPSANTTIDSYAPIPQQVQTQPLNNNSAPIKMYNFNTSWCGWSTKFQPEWDNFMSKINSDNTLSSIVNVKDIKCDNDDNKELCNENKIDGFPTVLIDVKGKKTIYNGPRTAEDLMKTVKQIMTTM